MGFVYLEVNCCFMRNQVIISIVILFVFVSCDNSTPKKDQPVAAPKALQDKTISMDVVSKRYHEDLLNALYNNLLDTNLELKRLESEIEALKKGKSDSTETFDKYNDKNEEYFNSANDFTVAIKDSLLKVKMKDIIANSLTKYDTSISQYKNLLRQIRTKTNSLQDLHIALKIVRTLPLMEQYQKDYLPPTNSIDGYIKQLDKTIRHADTLFNK